MNDDHPDLFPVEQVLSPRLRWLQDHQITTAHKKNRGWVAYQNNDPRWDLSYDIEDLFQPTEEEAIFALMQRAGIPPFDPDAYRENNQTKPKAT